MSKSSNAGVRIRKYDVVIIGSGIVGATIARELSKYSMRVAVLDRASDVPSGASRANSAMIHGGFDDEPGTVKARFCAPGNKMYHSLCDELDFHVVPCGSYVCAFGEADKRHLAKLYDQGVKNGVPGLEIISGDVLRAKEPNASGAIVQALWCSSAAVVNNFEAVLAFMDNAQMNGVELFLETEVRSVLVSDDGRVEGVAARGNEFRAPIVINAAGVHSDQIARMVGDESFALHPTRGEYFIFDKNYGNTIKSFFFSCPSELGKGITVARTADGNILVGPTSVRQADRDWNATTYDGLEEVMAGAQKIVPSLTRAMSITTFAGVRANTASGDFHIELLAAPRGFVNVAGIKSPGFTAAPAIAEYVVGVIKEELGYLAPFSYDPHFVPERKHIPRFADLSMEERATLALGDPKYAQIVCRCETVTEAQVIEAIRRGARTVAGVKIWTRAGAGRCQGGFCGPRVVEILARELGLEPDEVTRHGGDSRLLVGRTKDFWFRGEAR